MFIVHLCIVVLLSQIQLVEEGLASQAGRAGQLSGDDGLAPECMGPRAYHTLLRSATAVCSAAADAGMAPRLERHHRSL